MTEKYTGIVNVKEGFAEAFDYMLSHNLREELRTYEDYQVIGKIVEDIAAGIIVYRVIDGAEFRISHMYTLSTMRHQGIATELMDYVFNQAMTLGCVVSSTFFIEIDKESGEYIDSPIYSFFDSYGHFDIGEVTGGRYKITADLLTDFSKNMPDKARKKSIPYFDMERVARKSFESSQAKYLSQNFSTDRMDAVKPLCRAVLSSKENLPVAVVLITARGNISGSDQFDLAYAWCKAGSEISLIFALVDCCDLLLKAKLSDPVIWIDAVNESSVQLTENCFKGIIPQGKYMMASTYE